MNLSKAILATLAYHDIFDYPLSIEEIHRFCTVSTTKANIQAQLDELIAKKTITKNSSYFSLRGRGAIESTRLQREKYSTAKLKKAFKYSIILHKIPQIQMVAITGALAMKNSSLEDDIDLMVVSLNGTVWTTRLMANLILRNHRRKPGLQETKDKACLNIFLEQNSLKIGTRNLYIAHEIAQTQPIWQKGNTYDSFINANSWIKNYLPNWTSYSSDSFITYPQTKRAKFMAKITPLEMTARLTQVFYMRKRRTTEKVAKGSIFLHPRNTKKIVLDALEARLSRL